MEFDSEWVTLGRHRVRLKCTRGFPTERTRRVAELVTIAIDNNLSARARLVEVTAISRPRLRTWIRCRVASQHRTFRAPRMPERNRGGATLHGQQEHPGGAQQAHASLCP